MNLNDFDLNNIQRIGLDKIRLSNLAIMDEIDFDTLKQDGNNVEIYTTTDKKRRYRRYVPDTNTGITKIIVKDNQLFSDLIIAVQEIQTVYPLNTSI